MTGKKLAVLMACFNRKEKTLSCLEKTFKQKGLYSDFTIEIYLVDDASTDGTPAAVQKLFPEVNVIEGTGNLYWNRGMHTAWKFAAKGNFDYYLWLNDDTELFDDAINEMLICAEATNGESIICGSIESPYRVGELSYGGGRLLGNKYIANYPNGILSECDLINGNCVLVPHAVFLKVGNLDWHFVHAIGDNDYSLRAKKKGIKTLSTGRFVASCPRNESLPKWCLPQVRLKDRLKNLYSPLGNSHPFYYFIYENRHFGLFTALKHCLSIHLRVLIPTIWK